MFSSHVRRAYVGSCLLTWVLVLSDAIRDSTIFFHITQQLAFVLVVTRYASIMPTWKASRRGQRQPTLMGDFWDKAFPENFSRPRPA